MSTISSINYNPYSYLSYSAQNVTPSPSGSTNPISLSLSSQTGDMIELSENLNLVNSVQSMPESEQNTLFDNSANQEIIDSSSNDYELNNLNSGAAILEDSNIMPGQINAENMFSLANQLDSINGITSNIPASNGSISPEELQQDMLNLGLSSYTSGLNLIDGSDAVSSLFSDDSQGIFGLSRQMNMLTNNANLISNYSYNPSSGVSYNTNINSSGSILDSLA